MSVYPQRGLKVGRRHRPHSTRKRVAMSIYPQRGLKRYLQRPFSKLVTIVAMSVYPPQGGLNTGEYSSGTFKVTEYVYPLRGHNCCRGTMSPCSQWIAASTLFSRDVCPKDHSSPEHV